MALIARAPRIATGALVIALTVEAALIVSDLVAGLPLVEPATASATGAVPAATAVDIAAILNANLFGQTMPGVDDGANAPTTSLPLVLAGVIAGDIPGTGLAILGTSASAARVHAIGDSVPGGAKLHSVYGDRVLLDRDGTIEALKMPREGSGGSGAQVPPPVTAAPAGGDRVQQLIQERPSILGGVMNVQAVLAQGKLRGYRLYPGTSAQTFRKFGLRGGDLVIAVNGTPLDDPARSSEVLGTLSSASDARVTIVRNGREQEIVLDLAQAAAETPPTSHR